MGSLYTYSLVLVFILNISLSVFLLTKGIRNKVNISFSLMIISIAFWALGLGNFIGTKSLETAKTWATVYYIAPILIAHSSFIFSRVFPKNQGLQIKKELIIAFPTFLLVILVLTVPNFLIERIVNRSWGKEVILDPWDYFLYSIHFLLYFYVGLYILFKKIKKSKGINRIQINFVFYSLLIASIFGVLFNLFLPMFGNYKLIWVGPQFTIIIIVLILFAIIKHELFDIRIYLGRAVYLISATAYTYIIFLLVGYVNILLFEDFFETSSLIFNLFVVLIFVSSYKKVINTIDRKVEKSIVSPNFDPSIEILSINDKLSTELQTAKIANLTIMQLKNNFDSRQIGIIINTENQVKILGIGHNVNLMPLDLIRQWIKLYGYKIINLDILEYESQYPVLKKHLKGTNMSEFRLIAPFKIKEIGFGAIILGPKPKEVPYNSIEMNFIKSLASLLSTSFTKALLHEEVQRFNETLQLRVDQATKKLQKKNIELEEALRKERDMLDIIGHELRTPLSTARNILDLIKMKIKAIGKEKLENEYVEDHVDRALENINREIKILETILSSSRIENDRLNLYLEKVEANDVVNDSIATYKEQATKKGLKIKAQLPKTKIYTYADRGAIQQVLDNLVSNAVKYTPEGSVEISLEKNIKTVKFTVADTGEGIPKKEIDNLGKKFYRLNPYVNKRGDKDAKQVIRPGGTGIGLFVVFKLLKFMNGDIKIKSTVGKGSSFSFTLPIYKNQKPKQLVANAPKNSKLKKLPASFERRIVPSKDPLI